MERLTGREYAETIGSLQNYRELLTVSDAEFERLIGYLRNRREQVRDIEGWEPADIVSALAKLTKGCTPVTVGIEFTTYESGA